jgi:Heparinase II/III-like protein
MLVTEAQLERARRDRSYPRMQIFTKLMAVCERRRLTATPDDLFAVSPVRDTFVWDAFISELSVATAITDDHRYFDHVLPFLRLLATRWRVVASAEPSSETSTSERDLFIPYVFSTLASFYDLQYARLSDEDADVIRSTMVAMAEQLWAELPVRDYGLLERTAWNHSIIAYSCIGLAGLVLHDHRDAAAWLESGIERTRYFFDAGISAAGMTFEGLHYCGYVFKVLGRLLNALRNCGLEAQVAPEGSEPARRLHRLPQWYAHDMWPKGGWLQNYNDSMWDPHSPLLGFLVSFAHYEPELCAVVWDQLVGREGRATWGFHPRFSSLADSLLFFPSCRPDRAALERLDTYFVCPEVGYLCARDGWEDEATVFTFNSGRVPCELHDQSDNNSFTFIARGEPVILDSGAANRREEGSASSAHGHNVVLIDGRGGHVAGQGTCVEGEILGIERTNAHVAVVGDATASYNENRYNPVMHALRHAVFVKEPFSYLVIYDDIQKDKREHVYEYLLHVPFAEGNDLTGPLHSLTVSTEQGEPAATIKFLRPDRMVVTAEAVSSRARPFGTHVLWRCGTRAANPHFVVLYLPRGGPTISPAAEVQDTAQEVAVRLRWPHGTDEFVFSTMGRGARPVHVAVPTFTRTDVSQQRDA